MLALLRRLADHAIARHHPTAADAEQPYVALFDAVAEAQAALVARWMLVGFVHGVMNTDNMTISGETIDYGPCAFMDVYDPTTVFSSIDHGGRYAYGNQPRIAHWNLARLAEAMLRLFGDEVEPAIEAANGVLHTFSERYDGYWSDGMRAKLGLADSRPGDVDLARDLLDLLNVHRVDMTSAFRALSAAAIGDETSVRRAFPDPGAYDAWAARWRSRLAAEGRPAGDVAAAMDHTNPAYIPRNHLVEDALAAATERRPGALRAAPRRRHPAIRHPSRLASLRRAGTAGLGPLPDVLRDLRAVLRPPIGGVGVMHARAVPAGRAESRTVGGTE